MEHIRNTALNAEPIRWKDLSEQRRRTFIEECVGRNMTTNEIAEMCGAASRNVIIGFAHRRGIILSGKKCATRQRPKVTRRPWNPHVTLRQTKPKDEVTSGGAVLNTTSGDWGFRPIDQNTLCAEDGCSEPVVLRKPYCRAHCAQYYVIPRKRT